MLVLAIAPVACLVACALVRHFTMVSRVTPAVLDEETAARQLRPLSSTVQVLRGDAGRKD
jgi:hypothetical protein